MSYRAGSSFANYLMGFTKLAYGMNDASKVLQAAKKYTLPRGAKNTVSGFGISPTQEPMHVALPNLAPQLKNQYRLSKQIIPRLAPAAQESFQHVLDASTNASKEMMGTRSLDQLTPKGSIYQADKRGLNQFKHFLKGQGHELPTLNPADKKMLNSVFQGHELDELNTRPGPALRGFGHLSPDVLLREHNRVATMPKEHENVRKFMQTMRGSTSETDFLGSHGVDYGNSPRLSRHARRRLSDLMNVEAIDANVEALNALYGGLGKK